VLLVDLPMLQATVGGGGASRVGAAEGSLSGIFREAEMNDAVVFFDECENVFAQRPRGGDRLLNQLLLELEKYPGIVFMATNRPLDLDDAMHRRISAVFEFITPDHTQRRQIWEVHATERKLPLASDIDWDAVALKYELTGGFIKNALVAALMRAVARDSENPVVSSDDVAAGCSMQTRGCLALKDGHERRINDRRKPLDDLVLPTETMAGLKEIIEFDRARTILYSHWGFSEETRRQQGTIALLIGPPSTGKGAACGAIAFETDRPIKRVRMLDLLVRDDLKRVPAVHHLLRDARLVDAVVVIEDAHRLETRADGEWAPSTESILEAIERYPGVVLLTANVTNATVAISRLRPCLRRSFKFIVPFRVPPSADREKIWKLQIPEQLPLAQNVNLEALAKRFEFGAKRISSVVFRSAAAAATRGGQQEKVTMADLETAAEAERAKGESALEETMRTWFT